VNIEFQSEGNFSFARGNTWFLFASFLGSSCLASLCLLEASSGKLLAFPDLGSYVISRGDGGREDFNTRAEVDNSSKGDFKW